MYRFIRHSVKPGRSDNNSFISSSYILLEILVRLRSCIARFELIGVSGCRKHGHLVTHVLAYVCVFFCLICCFFQVHLDSGRLGRYPSVCRDVDRWRQWEFWIHPMAIANVCRLRLFGPSTRTLWYQLTHSVCPLHRRWQQSLLHGFLRVVSWLSLRNTQSKRKACTWCSTTNPPCRSEWLLEVSAQKG